MSDTKMLSEKQNFIQKKNKPSRRKKCQNENEIKFAKKHKSKKKIMQRVIGLWWTLLIFRECNQGLPQILQVFFSAKEVHT